MFSVFGPERESITCMLGREAYLILFHQKCQLGHIAFRLEGECSLNRYLTEGTKQSLFLAMSNNSQVLVTAVTRDACGSELFTWTMVIYINILISPRWLLIGCPECIQVPPFKCQLKVHLQCFSCVYKAAAELFCLIICIIYSGASSLVS